MAWKGFGRWAVYNPRPMILSAASGGGGAPGRGALVTRVKGSNSSIRIRMFNWGVNAVAMEAPALLRRRIR